jgi:hypothetical protein
MNRNIVLAPAAVAATILAAAGTAGADPTPAPTPGYQIPGQSGPTFPGVQQYPPWCLRNMYGCGFIWLPDTGTFQQRGGQ